jgi:4'-phosphopantetheinyl transferase
LGKKVNYREELWQRPLDQFALSTRLVHIWRINLSQPDSVVDEMSEILTEEELNRADRYAFSGLKEHFIVSRGALRTLIGAYQGVNPARVEISTHASGKPYVVPVSDSAPLRFNLAHSNELAICAFTLESEIGIDLEHIRAFPDAEQIAAPVFSPRENALLKAMPAEQKAETFFHIWVRKEAYVKSMGLDLSTDLCDIEVGTLTEISGPLTIFNEKDQGSKPWSLCDVYPGQEYVAAVAMAGGDWSATYLTWDPSLFDGHFR